MDCPICGKEAKTERGLAKHLSGGARYGGHELAPSEALSTAATALAIPEPFLSPEVDRSPRIAASPELSPEVRASFLYSVLRRLVDNKGLPKYQFERAIDGFLGAFLPQILQAKTGGHVELVAQEFPLKKKRSFQSTNVDYVLLRQGGERSAWMFVELKTDLRSLREEQNSIYIERLTPDTRMSELLADVEAIKTVSSQGTKYADLLGRFRGRPLDLGIELVYLSPGRHELLGVTIPFISITFEDLDDLELDEFAAEWALFQALVLPQLGVTNRVYR